MSNPTEPTAAGTFESSIRPLFREKDRRSMLTAFDLWAYADVRAHRDAILDAVSTGKMPCDGVWTDTAVQQFRSWVTSGSPE